MRPDERFVLCRPQGGLNDVLCQIELVCRYAERFNRKVIVDTNYHSSDSVRDRFSRYFISQQHHLVLDIDAIEYSLIDTTIFPAFIADKWRNYEIVDTDYGRVEKVSGQPITFDFSKDYAETLLVHQCAGSRPGASVAALSRLRLAPDLSTELFHRLNCISAPYTAVHIRNTDYTTNYQLRLNQLKNHPALLNCKDLFVATDNIGCLEYCRSIFPQIKVHSFSQLPQDSSRPLHVLSGAQGNIYDRNKDAILDLIMLALSRQLIVLALNPNKWSVQFSGFSLLAHDLQSAKTTLSGLIASPRVTVGS